MDLQRNSIQQMLYFFWFLETHVNVYSSLNLPCPTRPGGIGASALLLAASLIVVWVYESKHKSWQLWGLKSTKKLDTVEEGEEEEEERCKE